MPERAGPRKSRRKKRLKQKAARMKEDYRMMREGRQRASEKKHRLRKRQNNISRMYRELAANIRSGHTDSRVDSRLNTILAVGTNVRKEYDDDDFSDGA